MRIGYKKFKEIREWYGSSDFEIGYDRESLTLRFGYWQKSRFRGITRNTTRLF